MNRNSHTRTRGRYSEDRTDSPPRRRGARDGGPRRSLVLSVTVIAGLTLAGAIYVTADGRLITGPPVE